MYFGNYLTELDRGDVIAFLPGDDSLHMYPVAKAAFSPEAPYRSGLYRVGTDIPAGTYTITVQEDAAAHTSNDSGAFVMKDLDFDDDSITDTKYVIAGGSQTVTVQDGRLSGAVRSRGNTRGSLRLPRLFRHIFRRLARHCADTPSAAHADRMQP